MKNSPKLWRMVKGDFEKRNSRVPKTKTSPGEGTDVSWAQRSSKLTKGSKTQYGSGKRIELTSQSRRLRIKLAKNRRGFWLKRESIEGPDHLLKGRWCLNCRGGDWR